MNRLQVAAVSTIVLCLILFFAWQPLFFFIFGKERVASDIRVNRVHNLHPFARIGYSSPYQRNVRAIRRCYLMNHLYHEEHGVYPESLEASARFDNLASEEARMRLFFDLPYDDFAPEHFLYLPPPEGDVPGTTIVLATPRPFKHKRTLKRIVCDHSGKVRFVSEPEFVRRMEKQLRAVPVRK